MNGLDVENGHPPPDDEQGEHEHHDGDPQDRAGGSMSGDIEATGEGKWSLRASARMAWAFAGVVVALLVTSFTRLVLAILDYLDRHRQ